VAESPGREAEEPAVVSRTVQSTLGLLTGTTVSVRKSEPSSA